MNNLSQFYLEKLKFEIGENENKRKQSLDHFREWLTKHPFIKSKEIDDLGLLMYLRPKKYKMDESFESYEVLTKYFVSQLKIYEISDDKMEQIFIQMKSSFYVLKNRDAEGRRVIVVRIKKIEEQNISFIEFFKIFALFIDGLHFEEETQISGVVCIVDFSEMSFDYFLKTPVEDLIYSINLVKHYPVRIKLAIIIGLPSFANKILKIISQYLSEKIKSRLIVIDKAIELNIFIDTTELLNDNYEYNEDNFLDFKENIKRALKNGRNIEINLNDIKVFEKVGSFRKLEID
ncbi:hypothetical protein PVAND_002228 [Polypedilum vanderplanki]|uniref:CRAL-TRIO domain-containing protein n=1 Tax=Polypedilum vanderplanki TaxID=319348 RepID=A0A9J6BQY1_POLVA|nr:hypothetical protein PVAND_002228 [Polypedilum vanderplanki]